MGLKKPILTLLLLAGYAVLPAQTARRDTVKAPIEWGFKAGVSLSRAKLNDNTPVTGKMGFTGGVFAVFPLNPKIAFQVEANYVQKGFSYTAHYSGHSVYYSDYDVRIHSIDAALLMRFNLSNWLGVVVGPYYSTIAAYTSSPYYVNTYPVGGPYEHTVLYPRPANALGATAGIDMQWKQFVLSMRGSADLINRSSTVRYYSKSLQFGVGYKFALCNKK